MVAAKLAAIECRWCEENLACNFDLCVALFCLYAFRSLHETSAQSVFRLFLLVLLFVASQPALTATDSSLSTTRCENGERGETERLPSPLPSSSFSLLLLLFPSLPLPSRNEDFDNERRGCFRGFLRHPLPSRNVSMGQSSRPVRLSSLFYL